MKRFAFLIIVAAFVLLSLFVTLPTLPAPATASVVAPRSTATVEVTRPTAPATVAVTAVVVLPTPTHIPATVQPTQAPTVEPPIVVKPVEPPAQPPAQQAQVKPDTYSYYVLLSLKAQVLFQQYAVNVNGYGMYSVRYADNLGVFVPDSEVSPEVRMRLAELVATGR